MNEQTLIQKIDAITADYPAHIDGDAHPYLEGVIYATHKAVDIIKAHELATSGSQKEMKRLIFDAVKLMKDYANLDDLTEAEQRGYWQCYEDALIIIDSTTGAL